MKRRKRAMLFSPTGGAAAWTPENIAGLIWDYDPDVLSAGAISSLADSSGNGNTATQSTGGSQPIAVAAVLNGHTIMRFDGVDDRLVTASIAHGIGTGNMFWAAVVKAPAAGDHTIVANGLFAPELYINSSHFPDWYLSGDKVFGNSTVVGGTWYTIIVRRLSGTLDCSMNGVVDATTFANAANISDAVTMIGDDGSASASTPWNSDTARLLFGKTLSDANRTLLENYLRTRYAHY